MRFFLFHNNTNLTANLGNEEKTSLEIIDSCVNIYKTLVKNGLPECFLFSSSPRRPMLIKEMLAAGFLASAPAPMTYDGTFNNQVI